MKVSLSLVSLYNRDALESLCSGSLGMGIELLFEFLGGLRIRLICLTLSPKEFQKTNRAPLVVYQKFDSS